MGDKAFEMNLASQVDLMYAWIRRAEWAIYDGDRRQVHSQSEM